MGTQNIILDDCQEEDVLLGLVRTVKQMPDHEFIFKVNSVNNFNFCRIEDLPYCGEYYDHHFTVYEGYDKENKNCIKIICNKSVATKQKKEITELFIEEEKEKYLISKYKDIDYIIKTSDGIDDFSVILLPNFLAFEVQEYILSSEEELYQMIQYYE